MCRTTLSYTCRCKILFAKLVVKAICQWIVNIYIMHNGSTLYTDTDVWTETHQPTTLKCMQHTYFPTIRVHSDVGIIVFLTWTPLVIHARGTVIDHLTTHTFKCTILIRNGYYNELRTHCDWPTLTRAGVGHNMSFFYAELENIGTNIRSFGFRSQKNGAVNMLLLD